MDVARHRNYADEASEGTPPDLETLIWREGSVELRVLARFAQCGVCSKAQSADAGFGDWFDPPGITDDIEARDLRRFVVDVELDAMLGRDGSDSNDEEVA